MNLAPIALFVYNRPWHAEQTLKALSKNLLAGQSVLYVFSDGPKEGAGLEDIEKITQVRRIVRETNWCKEVRLIERELNVGLAENVIRGITDVVNRYGKIIVLEDDLITSPYFLRYCNDGLNIFKDSRHVYSINGFQYPLDIEEVDIFLSPLAVSSWGWSTWADRWKIYDRAIPHRSIIQENAALRNRFNFGNRNFAAMLSIENSWAIRWYYSVFARNGLGVFPTKSLIYNAGFDGSGVHYTTNVQSGIKQDLHNNVMKIEFKDQINFEYLSAVLDYFESHSF